MEESLSSLTRRLFPVLASKGGMEVPDPFALSLQSGLMVCSAVTAAVQLRLPDALGEDPQAIEALAQQTHTHAPTLLLLMRALTGIGIFTEIDGAPPCFAHTARSRALRKGVEGGMADLVALWGAGYQWDAWKHLAYTIRTGKPALEAVYGEQTTLWTYLNQNPQEALIFQRGLTTNANLVMPAILATVAFSGTEQIMDVGGGHGQLCFALLEQYPQMHAVLFDRPAVIAQAQERLRVFPETLASRCTLVAGDFLSAVLPGADCCILKNVLMDWPDDDYLQILRCCRSSMNTAKGRLLVIEPVIGADTPFTHFFSLQMAMMMKAARHRTLEEHQVLFKTAGFQLSDAQSLGLEQMLLEGSPV